MGTACDMRKAEIACLFPVCFNKIIKLGSFIPWVPEIGDQLKDRYLVRNELILICRTSICRQYLRHFQDWA